MDFLETYLKRHIEWSQTTFGVHKRTKGIIKHIRKGLNEVEENPDSLFEWIDVIILALDGAWRRGFSLDQIIDALVMKQEINIRRSWPSSNPDEPTFHSKE